MNKRKQIPWAVRRAQARTVMENSEYPREEPDFAPDPEDQETLDEIYDEAARRSMDTWVAQEDGEEPELDDFGNPIPAKEKGRQVPWAVRKAWAITALEDARNDPIRQSNK